MLKYNITEGLPYLSCWSTLFICLFYFRNYFADLNVFIYPTGKNVLCLPRFLLQISETRCWSILGSVKICIYFTIFFSATFLWRTFSLVLWKSKYLSNSTESAIFLHYKHSYDWSDSCNIFVLNTYFKSKDQFFLM